MSAEMFYEDVPVGFAFETGGIVVTESHVVAFAGLSGDFFDVHMDDRFAQSLGFPGRIAHGLLCLAMVDGLKNRAQARFAGVASLSWQWNFRQPVLIDDRITARVRVSAKRMTRRPDRGILTLQFEVCNQGDQVVEDGTNLLLVRTRAGEGPGSGS